MVNDKSADQWLACVLKKLESDGFNILEGEFLEGFRAVAIGPLSHPKFATCTMQHANSFFFTFAEWPLLGPGDIFAYASHAAAYAKGYCSRPYGWASPIEVAWTFAVAIVDRMDDSLEHEVLSQKPIVRGSLGDSVELPIVYDLSTKSLCFNAKRPFWRMPGFWGLKKMIHKYLDDPWMP